jgi:hypothetical protein
MDTHPGSELSVPQLLHALEGKLDQLMKSATRYAIFSSTERRTLNSSFLRIRMQPQRLSFERGRGIAHLFAPKCEPSNPQYLQVGEIEARTRAIWMSARYLQNSFVPVNRLPPEVLGLIPSSLHSKRDLVNATAVCRYWRNALLSSPDLWCDIDCSGNRGPLREQMFQDWLERSRNAPLNVRLTSIRYLPDIAPHLARFSALGIHLVVPEQLTKIAAHFSEPAPILRTLSISATAPRTPIRLSIPPDLFGGYLAPLRTLRLASFSVVKLPQQFPQLTRFELQAHPRAGLETSAMLGALEQMPSLEVLHVKFCPRRRNFPSSASTLRLVTLHKLKEVELSSFESSLGGPPAFIPPLLSALTLPSVEQITIGMLPPPGSTPLPDSFEERLPNLAETESVEVYVDQLRFTVSFHGLQRSRLLFADNYGSRQQFQREGFCGTPFLSVKKMVVTFNVNSIHNTDSEKYFFELLQAMERLEYLEVKGQCARLLTLWSSGKYLIDQQSVCPSLQSLVVTKKSDDGSVSELLAKLATVRRSHGVPLLEVVEVVSGG